MNVINEIRVVISKGKLEKAIEVSWNNFENSEFEDDIIAIRARYNSLNNKVINGLLSTQDSSIEENRITNSLLKFLNKVEIGQAKKSLINVNQNLDNYELVNNLLGILDETYKGLYSQAEIRNRLYLNVKKRLSLDDPLEFEEFFSTYYSKMNEEELEYHNSIRDYTENILNTYNRKALELIIGNQKLKEEIPMLNELERHLLVWLGKYEYLFKTTPSLSLIYTGVVERVPFPKGIELKLMTYLKKKE